MIEVNEYVRTDKGYIFKVDEEKKNLQIANFLDVEYGKMIKHSKQLIDLIEVGDIVEDEYNKYEVAFVKDDKIYCNDYNLDDSLITLREQDIKAILTKEQFETNCYKVGGEDEQI